jgi:general secretion pathway protein G
MKKVQCRNSLFTLAGRSTLRSGRSAGRGFTLIELMIVMTIILILIGIAAGNYQRSVLRSREAVLKQDLQEIRKAIDNYTMDKQAAPQSLDDLAPQYLHIIPTDPITRKKDWTPVVESVALTPDQAGSGITDVHSSSEQISPFEGTAYNTW